MHVQFLIFYKNNEYNINIKYNCSVFMIKEAGNLAVRFKLNYVEFLLKYRFYFSLRA